jgi:broad specificity phosphatase PhoE
MASKVRDMDVAPASYGEKQAVATGEALGADYKFEGASGEARKISTPAPAGENYPDVALRLHNFLGTLTREAAGESVLVVCHSVVVLIFRKLLERLSEQQLLFIDGDKAQEVQNRSVTHYEFDSRAGDERKAGIA